MCIVEIEFLALKYSYSSFKEVYIGILADTLYFHFDQAADITESIEN